MKHLYYILMVLFLGTASLQQPFAAAAAEAVESPEIAALRTACQQVLNDVHTTLISREEYVSYLKNHHAHLYGSLPEGVSRETLDMEGNYWVSRMEYADKLWQALETRVGRLETVRYNREEIGSLISDFIWSGFGMARNMEILEHYCPNLLTLCPDAKRVYGEDARILGDAITALLPFMPEAYQADFAKYHLEDVRQKVCKKNGSTAILIPDLGVVGHDGTVQITTSRGTRVKFLFTQCVFLGIEAKEEVDTGTTEVSLRFDMHSGFKIRLGGICKKEADVILKAYTVADERDREEEKLAKRLAAMERIKADQKARKSAVEAEVEASKASTFAAMKAERDRKKGKPISSAAAPVTSETEALASKAAAKLLEELGGAPLESSRGRRGGKGHSSADIVKASAAGGAGASGAAGASGGGSVASAAAAGASASAPVMQDAAAAAAGAGATQRGPRPPHQVVVPVVLSSGDIDRTHSTRTGPKQTPIDTLTVLLKKPLEGTSFTSINTVHWDAMVDMLGALGFAHVSGGLFMNSQKNRLNLHALHYDEYRMNYDLRRILFRQLDLYDFTEDRLKVLLAAASGSGDAVATGSSASAVA